MGPGWYYVTLWVVGEAEGEGGRRKITNWVTQAFMRADVFFIQSDTDMPGNIFSLCSKEQDLKSFRSGDYLYTSEFIRIPSIARIEHQKILQNLIVWLVHNNV